MGGFHLLDLIVVAGLALVIFGPKALQSLSHSAGRSMAQVKDAKNKLMADLPMEEISKVTETVSKIPMSPQQAAKMLIAQSSSAQEKASSTSQDSVATSAPAPAEE